MALRHAARPVSLAIGSAGIGPAGMESQACSRADMRWQLFLEVAHEYASGYFRRSSSCFAAILALKRGE